MTTYIVTIQDKDMPGEPTVALGVVVAPHAPDAVDAADDALDVLARAGRGRCVASAHEVVPGTIASPGGRRDEPARFVRVGAIIAHRHTDQRDAFMAGVTAASSDYPRMDNAEQAFEAWLATKTTK